jgi:cytochrome c-type biogenesis protein
MTARRAFAVSLLFSLGLLITLGAIGAVTAAAGRMMGDVGRWGRYGVAVIFLAAGLYLLDVMRLPLPNAAQPGLRRKGLAAAFVLGLVFGVALGPCTFAYLAPLLGVAFRLAAARPAYGVWLLVAYGAGHCGVIVLAGTFSEAVQNYLNWNEASRGAVILRKLCGGLVLLGGLWMLYAAC